MGRTPNGIRLVAFGRDLLPAREGGLEYGVLEQTPETPIIDQSAANAVAVRRDSVLALYRIYIADRSSQRHRAQRFTPDLTPVGPNIELPPPNPSWTPRKYRYNSVAAAWYDNGWYVAASSSAGIMLFVFDDAGVLSGSPLVTNDSFHCAETGDCDPEDFPLRQLAFNEAGGKLWLHFYDLSDPDAQVASYRIVEAAPNCTHLSTWDKATWAR